jgi:hypothetical protein
MPLFRTESKETSRWSSRAKLVVGAAGLLLFIVGVKRTYRMEETAGTALDDVPTPTRVPDPRSPVEARGATMADQG